MRHHSLFDVLCWFSFPSKDEQFFGLLYPLTSFTATYKRLWVRAWPWGVTLGSGSRHGDIPSSQATQHFSSSCASSIPSQSPAGCILTSSWPSWPWNWSVPWRVCWSTQVRGTIRLFLQSPAHCLCHKEVVLKDTLHGWEPFEHLNLSLLTISKLLEFQTNRKIPMSHVSKFMPSTSFCELKGSFSVIDQKIPKRPQMCDSSKATEM